MADAALPVARQALGLPGSDTLVRSEPLPLINLLPPRLPLEPGTCAAARNLPDGITGNHHNGNLTRRLLRRQGAWREDGRDDLSRSRRCHKETLLFCGLRSGLGMVITVAILTLIEGARFFGC